MAERAGGGGAFQAVEEAAYRPLEEGWVGTTEEIDRSLLSVLARGLEEHRQALEALGLEGKAPAERDVRTERLLAYRRILDAHLVTPLMELFARGGPASTTLQTMTAALSEAVTRTRALPKEVEEPWPAGGLEPQPTDSLRRRAGKRLARLVSSARRAGQSRALPLRYVAETHLQEVLAPTLDAECADELYEWAEWISSLERIWIEWGDAALPALVRAETEDRELAAESGQSTDRQTVADGKQKNQAKKKEQGKDTATVVATDPWETVRAAATRFSEAMEAHLATAPSRGEVKRWSAAEAPPRGRLGSDLAVAGSFLEPGGAVPEADPALNQSARVGERAVEVERALSSRLRLLQSMLSILSGTTAVQQRLNWRVREQCLGNVDALVSVAADLSGILEELGSGPDEPTPEALSTLEARVAEALVPAAEALPPDQEVEKVISVAADTAVDALFALVRQAPASISVRADEARPRVRLRRLELRVLPFQELARQAFDALRIERVRSTALDATTWIEEVRADVLDLPGVASFAFEAARQEMKAGDEGWAERANALVREALSSMVDSLRASRQGLRAGLRRSQTLISRDVSAGSLALLDRLAAGRVQARLFAARSHVARVRSWINETWGPPVDRAYRRLTRRLAWLRARVAREFRRGSAMVAGTPVADEASQRSVKALADRSGLSERIPLVYQRLFSPEPIEDPTLLAGRGEELAEAKRRWERWRQEDGIPTVIRGRPGSGITSFLHVLLSSIREAEGTARYLSLEERIPSEEALASFLAAQLELPDVTTMDDLSQRIFEAPRGSLPDACALDNLEHLYLRVPGGTDLIERLLTLMSETEPRIFWMGGVTSSAWQIVSAAEPSAVSQVDVLDLAPLGSSDLRTAILTRHRRSGLPVHFVEPESGRALLRERLRRLRDPKAYDDLLEADFFDRLSRTSSGNLTLALYQWLAAADFEKGDGVWMSQPVRPDFSVLDTLSLEQNFTLKAFLEHRTLSLEEHDLVFRLPHHESYQIVESIQHRHLLEVATAKNGEGASRSEVQEELRYRVRPLLLGAVVSHLRARNIVH